MTMFLHRISIYSVLAAVFFSVNCVQADFGNDGYTDYPDVLLRIVTAAAGDSRFKPHRDDGMVLYLRSARYVGPLDAPFGTIHIAYLFYVRSAQKGSKAPARGHSYIVFLDQNFKIRADWSVESSDTDFFVRDNKLWEGNSIILDYAHIPSDNSVICDGQPMGIPKWDKL